MSTSKKLGYVAPLEIENVLLIYGLLIIRTLRVLHISDTTKYIGVSQR